SKTQLFIIYLRKKVKKISFYQCTPTELRRHSGDTRTVLGGWEDRRKCVYFVLQRRWHGGLGGENTTADQRRLGFALFTPAMRCDCGRTGWREDTSSDERWLSDDSD
ncbi:hypothetical protein V8G54_014075, partial [Vigna mungo]